MHDTTCARRQMLLGLSHARPLLVPTPRPGVARQCPLAAALAAGGRRRRRNAAAEQAGEHAARWPSRPQEKAAAAAGDEQADLGVARVGFSELQSLEQQQRLPLFFAPSSVERARGWRGVAWRGVAWRGVWRVPSP